jgi:hypothetical protein
MERIFKNFGPSRSFVITAQGLNESQTTQTVKKQKNHSHHLSSKSQVMLKKKNQNFTWC